MGVEDVEGMVEVEVVIEQEEEKERESCQDIDICLSFLHTHTNHQLSGSVGPFTNYIGFWKLR